MTQLNTRVDAPTLEALDRLVERLESEAPTWAKGPTRADAARMAIIEGLRALGLLSPPPDRQG